jgi:glycerophosphoryl diester phosphodiesterase
MTQAHMVNRKSSRLKIALFVFLILLTLNIALHFVFALLTHKGEVSAVSHRGAAAIAPENTLSGVRAGVEAGAPFIEIDVRATSDGALVLMHDSAVDRTTDGGGKVGGLSLHYISGLDAGSWFSDKFRGERVPVLDSVLQYMKGKPSELVIEVKSPGRYPEISARLVEALRRFGMEKDAVVISFDTGWVFGLGELIPEATLGVLYVYPLALPPPGAVEYASVFWPSLVIDPTLLWRLKERGFKVWSWNIDNYLLARFLVWKGVDGLTLDNPALLGGN